jgi:hypothetical protein
MTSPTLTTVRAGCHEACAVGCSRPRDITACTTRYYVGKYWNCDRCKTKVGRTLYRALNTPNNEGCTVGPKTNPECKAPKLV